MPDIYILKYILILFEKNNFYFVIILWSSNYNTNTIMNSENSPPESKNNEFDDEITQEREKDKDKQRSSFLNKLITSRTDESLQEPKKHRKHNSLMKGSKKIMNKLFKLKTKNTLQKKEEENANEEDKSYQQKEIRELLKSETMITRNVKSLNKEKKINDTIVAVMSFLSIIICFCQVKNKQNKFSYIP